MNMVSTTKGWGIQKEDGSEFWDTNPVFAGTNVTFKDKIRLFFYPKKYFLYQYLWKQLKHTDRPLTIVDVGCGTGATVIDLKKMFGVKAQVIGVDVIRLQIDVGQKKLAEHGIDAQLSWYDGLRLPFADHSVDAIYSSDVLGHVPDARLFLAELHRVLRPHGVLAMFTESALGKHALIRKYLFDRGVNTDPHAQFHISLHSKQELRAFVKEAGFKIEDMRTAFWLTFFVHPDELYETLQAQDKFFLLRLVNKGLYSIKKKLHPYSTAATELYGWVEMRLFGSWLESQGYVILAKKQ